MSCITRSLHLPVIAALLLACPGTASAHAIIVTSQPASGATIDKDAVAIRLRINSRIDHARSRLKLRAPDGAEQALIPAADATADEIDADQVIARVLQTVGLPQVGAQPVPQGQYPPGQQHAPNPGHGPNGYAGQQVPQSAGPMDPNSAPANRNSPQYGG